MFNNYISKTLKFMGLCGKILYTGAGHRLRVWTMSTTCWITEATNTHSEYVILITVHWNSGYTDAPQCYVTCTLPVLLFYVIKIL